MSKPAVQPVRIDPPPGWGWADWSGATETLAAWNTFKPKERQTYRGKMEAQVMGVRYGRPVPREIFFVGKGDDGIGKVKLLNPNPGSRAYCFQDLRVWYISHIAQKHDGEHEEHVATAKRARDEHIKRRKEREAAQRKGRTHSDRNTPGRDS